MALSTSKKKIVKLSQLEYNTLSTLGSLTKDRVTYTYSPDDTIYVTPSVIYFSNVAVTSNDWVDNSTTPDQGYEFYAYKAELDCPGILSNSLVQIIYADEQARSGDYCNPCETSTDIVTIYSNNNSAIVIPMIVAGEPTIIGSDDIVGEQLSLILG